MAAPEPINMPPQVWGPIFWATLHIASLGYSDTPTERQKKNMIAFYESMVDVLPCPICRKHYEQNLEEMPIKDAVNTRMELIHWVFTMHNRVNVQLGKREYSFEEFVESMRNLETSQKACPPSFHNSNAPLQTQFKMNEVNAVDGLLLGTGITLIAGCSIYYIYTEFIRKGK